MISITCTQCRTVLTIDDAFAGGVCRCQHCGTIQTVPKAGAVAASAQNPSTSKALYQNQAAARTTGANVATTGATSPSGLDDLAQAVVSSGLSGSGLRSGGLAGSGASSGPVPKTPQAELASPARAPAKSPAKAPAEGAESKKKLPIIPIAIGGGAVVVGAIVLIVILALRGGGGAAGGGPGAGGGPSNAVFSDVKLSGNSVAYVIDRGNSIHNDFDEVKAATYESVKTLGADGKFAVILWNTDGADIAFPETGMRNATSDQTTLMHDQLDKVQATGASHLRGGLERALARNPSSIVIITGKDTRLAEDDEIALTSARDSSAGKVKFYLIAVSKENPTFKLAAGPNFEYHMIQGKELH